MEARITRSSVLADVDDKTINNDGTKISSYDNRDVLHNVSG